MTILNCLRISLSYGTKKIIENISFPVEGGSKVGIIGVNGAGKTTLFRIITGELEPSSGSVYIKPGTSVGFLSQMLDPTLKGKTVLEAALMPFSKLAEDERQLNELTNRMELGDQSVIARYTALCEAFVKNGGYEYKSKTRSFLKTLGFEGDALEMPCELLSGGQKTRLMLAVLLLREPDIILLDEPTNHLDIAATEWLESIISASKKTFLIISHDRYFLDKVTDTTVEIENNNAISYKGNYSVFKEKKRKQQETYAKHYELQQREIKRLEDFIENQKRWNRERNIIAAESRMKAIERMDKLDKPSVSPKKISFKFASSEVRSKDVLSVENLAKSFPEKQLFKELSFEMHKGDRLFVIGRNGSGKSTLLKILTGRIQANCGDYFFGHSQKIAFYDQETQDLDDSNTVIEEIWTDRNTITQTQIRSHLARFGFEDESIYKQVSQLSGGERARLSIAKLILSGASLLILDEPTNHLDIASKEVLESALAEFDGAILSVSHDRYFIKSLANHILEIDFQSLTNGWCFFKGKYSEYLSYKQSLKVTDITSSKSSVDTIKKSKEIYLAEKEKRAKERKNARQKANLEKQIKILENKLEIISAETEKYASDYTKLSELYEEEQSVKAELEEAYEKLLNICD